MQKSIWLSYDLGIKGDYEGLYQWLDSLNAVECGNSIAFFKMDIAEGEDLVEKLKSAITANVAIKNGERFYLIYRKADKNIAGKYIIGNRKSNPWTGYKEQPAEEDA
jgi:hypothetical protein